MITTLKSFLIHKMTIFSSHKRHSNLLKTTKVYKNNVDIFDPNKNYSKEFWIQ